jgi:hypothetical protein
LPILASAGGPSASRSGAAIRPAAQPPTTRTPANVAAISVPRPGRGTLHAGAGRARARRRWRRSAGVSGEGEGVRLGGTSVGGGGTGGGRSSTAVVVSRAFRDRPLLRWWATAAVRSRSRSVSPMTGGASSSSASSSTPKGRLLRCVLAGRRGASPVVVGAASSDRSRSISAVARSRARPAARSSGDFPYWCSRRPHSRSSASCWSSIGREYDRLLVGVAE